MMLKLISCVLSFSLIVTSLTPSFAQVAPVRRDVVSSYPTLANDALQTDISRRVAQQVHLAQAELEVSANRVARSVGNGQTLLPQQEEALQEINALVFKARLNENLSATEEDSFSLDEFVQLFKKTNRSQLDQALKKCSTQEERDYILAQWNEQTDPGALVMRYNHFLGELGKLRAQQERELKAHLKVLAQEALQYKEPVVAYKNAQGQTVRSVDPVSEFLPLLAGLGPEVITPAMREQAATILRPRVSNRVQACMKEDTRACDGLLQNAAALAVLGTQQQDAQLVARVLEENYNGVQGAKVIGAMGPMLLAMNDVDPDYRAFTGAMSSLVNKAGEIGYWETVGNVLSLEKWVEATHAISEGGSTGGLFARGYENSFYKDENSKHQNLDNAWVDFGMVLAEESKKDPQLKAALDHLVNNQLVSFRIQNNSFQTGTNHNLLLTGLLAGGYQIHFTGMAPHTYLDGQGRSHQAADTRAGAAFINRKLKEINLTQSEWVAYVLYHTGKTDVDPFTERYLRNRLYAAYKRPEKPAATVGMNELTRPTAQELSTYESWNAAKRYAGAADLVITVASLVMISVMGVKAAAGGLQMSRTLTRATRIARAAAAGNVTRLASVGRVLRTARFYKYGTYMLGPQDATMVAKLGSVKLQPKARPATPQPTRPAAYSTVDMGVQNGQRTVGVAFTPEQENALLARRANIAPQQFTSQGAPVANTAKVQPVPAAPAAPAAATSAPAPAGNTPYIRGKVTNALGQEVAAWVKNPNYVQPAAKLPVRQLGWQDKARLQWAMNFKPAFQNLFSFGTSRYGLAAVAPGAAPVTSEAAVARAGNAVEMVQNIRAQQGMFITDEALRGGAGASYRVGAMNPGGVSASRYAAAGSLANPGGSARIVPMQLSPLSMIQALGQTGAKPAARSSTGGMLFSLPLPIPSFIMNRILGESHTANKQARNILNQAAPLATQLVAILKTPTSAELKQQALVRLYQMGKLTKILQNTLPSSAMQAVVELGRLDDSTLLGQRLYSLYVEQLIADGVNNITDTPEQGELLRELADVVSAPGFASQSRALWEAANQIPVMSAEDIGTTSFVPEADLERVYSSFRTEPDFVASHVTAQDKGSWVHYDNHIPFYYRDSHGTLSEEPVGILTQNKPSLYANLLSHTPLYWKLPKWNKPSTWFRRDAWKLNYMADKAGLDIPKGFVLALDENGQWKFVKHDRALAESNPVSQKLLKNIEAKGSMQVGLETPYSTADLLAVAKMLEKKTQAQRAGKLTSPLSFELALNSADSFKQMLKIWGFYIGLDTGAVLTGPFKRALKGIEGAPINAVANVIGGLGYLSPLVAAGVSKWMRQWGLKASMFGLFGLAGLGLGYSLFGLGMTGADDPKLLGLGEQSIPLVAAIFTGSLFGLLQPLVLNHYKNPVARTAANLEFSSTKQKARMLLTTATFALGLNALGGLEWTLAIPAAFSLLGLSFLLFLNTPLVRSATPSNLASANNAVVNNLLASVQKQEKPEISDEQKKAEAKEFARDYNETFSKSEAVRGIRDRVMNVYAGYAPLMAVVSQVVNAEGTLPLIAGEKIAQLVMVGFMFCAYQMRKWATAAVKSNRYTDDQLTGLSLPILAATSGAVMFMPFDSIYALATAAVVAALYVGTAVPGQLDNTRMQNIVSEEMQSRKQAVQNDATLSPQEREEQLAKLDRQEKDWGFRATRDYSLYNSVGLAGVGAATLISYLLSDKHLADNLLTSLQIYSENPVFTMDRLIFGVSAAVLGALAWRHRNLTVDFWRARHPIQITQENIEAGSVNAQAFGISQRNVGANLGKLNKTLKELQKLSIEHGLSSEKKMTDMLSKMVQVYNRLLAIKEVKGGMDVGLRGSFNTLLGLAQNYQKALEYNNLSVMLNREFDRLRLALSKDGALEELAENMPYLEEGTYALPKDHVKFAEAKDLIEKDLFQLAHRILNGSGVDARTYRLFIEYHNRAMADLQQYTAQNVADSKRALDLKRELNGICLTLKKADDMSGILETNAGPTSAKDVQALRDLLAGFPYEGEVFR